MRLDQHSAFRAEPLARSQAGRFAAVIAIPARNEEERIAGCLQALADQTTTERYAVVVIANNCTDRTVAIVRGFAHEARFPVILHEARLEGDQANAGYARRLAMDAAAALAGRDGVVMTTDADSRVNRNWIAANLVELRAGADLVCGSVSPDLTERAALPAHVYPQGALEYLFQRMAADLESLLDPLPHDPAPRHSLESGASLAVRADIYRRVGGVPDVRGGEDRAFVDRVRRAGGRVRHALGPKVATSCRLDGRAEGGWADDLVRRARDPQAQCHPVIEPASDLVRRASLRGALRASWPLIAPAEWVEDLGVAETLLIGLINASAGFEEAWTQIESESPLLARRRVAAKDLPAETHRLKKAVDRARSLGRRKAPGKSRMEMRARVLARKLMRRVGAETDTLLPRKRRDALAAPKN